MVLPAQLNLPSVLETHYEGLTKHPKSTLKAYYKRPDVEDRILTVYTNALKRTVPKTALVGGVAGFGVALAWGFQPLTAIFTVLGGIGVGAGAGVVLETQRLAVSVRVDTSYLAWKDSIEKPIFDSFQTVLNNYEPFETLRCQITLDFPKIAVVDGFGRVYDQEAIYKWIDRKGTHPITRERMTRQDLIFEPRYAGTLQEAMDAAFGSADFARINTENREEVINGLKAALRTIVGNHNEIIFTRAQQALDEAIAAGMPRVEARQLYLANTEASVRLPREELPEETQLKGLMAIVTAESPQEFKEALVKETPLAVNSIASKILSARANPALQEMLQEVRREDNSPAIDFNQEEGDLLDEAIRVFVATRPDFYGIEEEKV